MTCLIPLLYIGNLRDRIVELLGADLFNLESDKACIYLFSKYTASLSKSF
jgi:hypothetical protein